jgi:dienelactone hydrolase
MMQRRILLSSLLLAFALATGLKAQASGRADTVIVHSGALTLRALLWRPGGRGPFPAVLFNHGSYGSDDPLEPGQPAALGPVFARHGYVFLFLCRRGIGLSGDQGAPDGDLMDAALREGGPEGRNRVQLQLLETDELNDGLAGLAFLRGLPEVDPRRVAIAGHSFGGSLSLFLAARDTALRAVVDFSGSAYSWLSPELRARLLAAVGRTAAPVFFIHAANDFSVTPGKVLDAEMQRLGKPHRLRIYPAFGRTAKEGHSFVFGGVATWEPDVFAFLDEYLGL